MRQKMKRAASFLLVMALTIGMTAFEPMTTHAATTNEFTVDDIKYIIHNSSTTPQEVAVKDARNLSGEVNIPEIVNSLGTDYKVTYIYNYAFAAPLASYPAITFEDNSNVTVVNIPKTITGMWGAFADCTKLTAINVDAENPNYSSVDGVLFNKTQTELITYPAGKTDASYQVPATVTSLLDSSFARSKLTSIDLSLPTTLNIPYGTFNFCENMTTISIPQTVTSIGYDWDNVFRGCTSLTTIEVDGGNPNYSSINGVLFNKAQTRLLSYPAGKSETSYNIPTTVTELGYGAFSDSKLSVIAIPAGTTNVNESFTNCENLTAINVDTGNANYMSENGILYSKTKAYLIKYPANKAGGTYTLPSTTTYVYNNALTDSRHLAQIDVESSNINYASVDGVLFNKNITGLIKYPKEKSGTSYVVPSTVTYIENGAFFKCEQLDNISLPDALNSLYGGAFIGCTGITAMTVPANVQYMGADSFYGLENLEEISFLSMTVDPPYFYVYDGDMFSSNKKLMTIYVPIGTKSVYETALSGKISSGIVITEKDFQSISVSITPKTTIVERGSTQIFTATLKNATTGEVTWSLSGASKANTALIPISTSRASLSVPIDEMAVNLVITAVSVEDPSKSDSATVTLSSAPVRQKNVTISVPSGNGSVSGAGSYPVGSFVTLVATPNGGYRAVSATSSDLDMSSGSGISTSGIISLSTNANTNIGNITFLMPDKDVTVVVTFGKVYTVKATPNSAGYGSAGGGGQFAQGEQVTIWGYPASGYRHKDISGIPGGTTVSASEYYRTATFTMPNADVNAVYNYEAIPPANITSDITINLQQSSATYSPQSQYSVYVQSSETNTYRSQAVAAGVATVTISGLPVSSSGSNYKVSISMGQNEDWHWQEKSIKLDATAQTIILDIPKQYKITGKLSGDATNISDICVLAESGSSAYYGYTDASGNYEIRGMVAGTYNVKYSGWDGKYTANPINSSVTITNSNVANINFSMTKKGDLRVDVKKNGIEAFKAGVTLYKKDGYGNFTRYMGSTTVYQGGAVMEGVISETGEYKVELNYVQDRNGIFPVYVSSGDIFNVSGAITDTYGATVTYNDPTRPTAALSGEGNQVISDVQTVMKGNHLNLEIRYKNNGNVTIEPTFTIELPSGLSFNNISQSVHTESNLAPGKSGKHKAVIRIDDADFDTTKIKVKVTIGSDTFDFGETSLTGAEVTMFGQGAVKSSEIFKVYGDASKGSTVVIKNMTSNQVLATVTPNGRFYSADIGPLAEGSHKLIAEATLNGVKATSNVLNVDSKAAQITIKSVSIDSNGMTDLPMNKALGVRAFTAWVGSDMKGRDIALGVEFENPETITGVTYSFSDLTYVAVKSGVKYNATLNNWYGGGLKTIKATVTTSDRGTLLFIIAEATVLIDPSGVVTDSVTGLPVSGATMTCYILENGVWNIWNAELYGQVNPQKTDNDGKYGWMVPEGIYKVTAQKNGYTNYDTINDAKFSDLSGTSTIVIPPPREDVNISLAPINAGNDTSSSKNSSKDADTSQKATTSTTDTQAIIKLDTTPTISSDGKVSATVNTANLQAAISDAKAEIADGKDATISFVIKGVPDDAKNAEIILPSDAFKSISDTKNLSIQVDVGVMGSMTFNAEAISVISDQGGSGDVKISAEKVDINSLEKIVQDKVGDRPVYDFNLTIGDKHISDFGNGMVNVSLPYTLGAEENPDQIIVYYLSDSGELKTIPGEYDAATGTVNMRLTHFSKYVVAYNQKIFSDVKNGDWYKQSVDYIAAREITGGIGGGKYGSLNDITRADFLVMLMKAYDIDVSNATGQNFTDAGDTYYTPYLAVAKQMGIASGIGNNRYNPSGNLKREEMFTLISQTVTALGQKHEAENNKKLAEFTDITVMSDYAKPHAEMLLQAGIISGSGGKLNPKDTANRAEMASVIYQLIKF